MDFKHLILLLLFLNGVSFRTCCSAHEVIEKSNRKTITSKKLLQSSECKLKLNQVEEIYDEKNGIWMLNAEFIEDELENDIQIIVDCASEGDIVVFDVTTTIQPKSTINILKDLIFTGYTEDTSMKDEIFPESDRKVTFTCPKDNSIFDIQSSSVTLANMEIVECNLDEKDSTSPVIFNYECDDYENDGSIKFHHVTFRDNSNYLKSGCFSTSNDATICSSLEMENVNFYNNTSEGIVIGQLLPFTTMSEVTLVNNTFVENNITDTPGAFIFIPDGHELYADKIDAFDNNGTLFYLNNSSIELSNSRFENSTGYYVGYFLPVFINSTNGSIIITDSTFSNSSPMFIGVYNESILEIQNCIFESIYKVNSTVSGISAIFVSNSSIYVDNSIFRFNNGDYIGGGISSTGSNITIENSFFTNNTAEYGGAIYCRCDEYICYANIKSSYFENNTVNSGYGGAVRSLNNVSITIDDCEFVGNEASVLDGGAIDIISQGNASFYFTNSLFEYNRAKRDGGAIGVSIQGNIPFYFKNSLFKYNRAERNSGAMYFGECDDCLFSVDIESCTFENNTAISRNGGGIGTFASSNITIINSVFSYNYAFNYGGCINMYSEKPSNHYIYNSSFLKNSVYTNFGGGIAIGTTNATVNSILENCYFSENFAMLGGGAIYIDSTDMVLLNNTVFNNTSNGSGGGIYMRSRGLNKANMTIEDSVIRNNTCVEDGGGIEVYEGGSLALIRSYIDSNVANDYGGGVDMRALDVDADVIILNIINSTFIENLAIGGGGISLLNKMNVSIINSSFIRNRVNDFGASIYFETPYATSSLFISETVFEDNVIENNRGLAIIMAGYIDVYIIRSVFRNNIINSIDSRGGVISTANSYWYPNDTLTEMNSTIQYKRLKEARENMGLSISESDDLLVPSATVLIEDSEFFGNIARNSHNVLLDLGTGSLYNIKNCSFYDNHSKNYGNIYVEDAEFYCEKCTFYNNTCENSAGVLYSASSANNLNESLSLITIRDSNFIQNSAFSNGGAIYILRSRAIINNSTFYGNKGEYGGCIYGNGYNLELNRVLFSNNVASANGGAININSQAYESYFYANELYCDNNHAEYGGCVFFSNTNGITIIENSIFTNNNANSTSETYGGAICGGCYEAFSIITIENCSFLYNEANGDGGSMYLQGYFQIKISSTLFFGNRAIHEEGRGGAIVVYGQEWKTEDDLIQLFGSRFPIDYKDSIQNKYDVKGISNSEALPSLILEMENVEFNSNSSPLSNIGAIYILQGCIVDMNSCTFSNNYGQMIGSIYDGNSELYMDNCTFYNNSCSIRCGAIEIDHTNGNEMLNNVGLAVIQNSLFSNHDTPGYSVISIFSNTSAVYLIDNNTFIDNTAESVGGVIGVFNGGYLYSKDSYFRNNHAEDQGGAIHITNDSKNLLKYYLETCVFENNSATYGGAIYMNNGNMDSTECDMNSTCVNKVEIFMTNLTFYRNKADVVGGSMMVTDPSVLLVDCLGENTLDPKDVGIYGNPNDFLKNYDTSSLTSITCETWQNNEIGEGGYGEDIASNPTSVLNKFIISDDSDLDIKEQGIINSEKSYLIYGLKSGMNLPKINLTALDYFGNGPAYSIDQNLTVTMYSKDGLFTGQIPYDITNGSVITDAIELVGVPGNHTINIDFSVSTYNNIYITVELRNCIIGEEALNEGRICNPCNLFSYNFHPDTKECKPCPQNLRCDDRAIFPLDGYWHVSPCSTKIERCTNYIACSYKDRDEKVYDISNKILSCNLDNETITLYHQALCKEGYEGSLCGSCQIGYGRVGTFECIKCSSKTVAIFFFIFSGIIFICIASISIKGNLTTDAFRNEALNPTNGMSGPFSRVEIIETGGLGCRSPNISENNEESINLYTLDKAYIYKTTMTESFKIFINYVQVTATAIAINANWSKPMKRLLSTLDFFGSVSSATTFTSMDCIIESSADNTKSIIRHLFSIAIPFFIFIIISLFWILKKNLHKENLSYLGRRLLLTFLVVLYISYISITKYFVRFLYCENVNTNPEFDKLDETKRLWLEDTSIECYTGRHLLITVVIIIPLLIIFSLGFPFAASFVLVYMRSKKKLESRWVIDTVGFLYRAYRYEVIFWDSIIMLRKAALAIIVVFAYPLGGNQQGIIALLVLVIALSLHMSILPFKTDYDILNKCEHASLVVSILTYTSGLLFNDEQVHGDLRLIIGIFIIVINTLLVIGFAIIGFHRLYLYAKTMLVLKEIVDKDDYWLDVLRKIIKKSYKKSKEVTISKYNDFIKSGKELDEA